MSLNEGVARLKQLIEKEKRELKKLENQREESRKIYVNPRTKNFEREKIKLRLKTFLLPAIRRLENTIASLQHQTNAIEKGVKKIKTAQNRMTSLQTQKPQTQKPQNASTRKNHLTPAERKELENFEANLIKEFGPITQEKLINEARKMKAEENAMSEKILKNYHQAKSPELKKYYSRMLNAIADQVLYRMLTPEEEKELNNALAKLGGRRLTRRRR